MYMQTKKIINHITRWLYDYNKSSQSKGFVVGISGGIDSAVTSTLAANTKLPVLCIEMPILQNYEQVNRGKKHINWLMKNYSNIKAIECDLTDVFENFKKSFPLNERKNELALANTRSRLRMTTLYYYAQNYNYLVVGTGNKVEDFGIGFFTKYGDGGVDISPIADLLKSEVFKIGKELNIIKSILDAAPTDGLWENNKTDEDQIGASYDELEWAMKFNGNMKNLNIREKKVIEIYNKFHSANRHKMLPIPVCNIPKFLK